MYNKLDKSLIRVLQNSNHRKPVVDQVDKSLQKIFSDSARNLLYNQDINLTNSQKTRLRKKKRQIEQLVKSKNKRKSINQIGGFILPFVLPLLANLLTSSTKKLCLTQGRDIPTESTSWKASLPIN